jgi:uncharacterized protein
MAGNGGKPVTVVFSWDVAPGREGAFEEWAREVGRVAERFDGHLGATWFRPEGAGRRYYTVVRFTDEARLREWLDSPQRKELIGRIGGIATEHRHHTTGMETWFSLPGEAVPAPPRWKMAAVTFGAVYPLSLLIQTFLSPHTQPWPLPVRALLFPLLIVPLLTYAVMPHLSRLLRRWLYPATRTPPPARPGHGPGS